MGRFVSRKKLLFTHKPLATQNDCAPAESYQNLINGLFESLETLDITGVSDFFNLFPLSKLINIKIFTVFYNIIKFYNK